MNYPHNKSLPYVPSFSSVLERENANLQKRLKLLENTIEVLYKQNLQYAMALNQYKVAEKELKRGLERSQRVASDALTLFRQNQSKMRRTEKLAIEEWQDYCDGKTFEVGDTVGRYMEEVKQRLMDTEHEEIIIGMLDDHEV